MVFTFLFEKVLWKKITSCIFWNEVLYLLHSPDERTCAVIPLNCLSHTVKENVLQQRQQFWLKYILGVLDFEFFIFSGHFCCCWYTTGQYLLSTSYITGTVVCCMQSLPEPLKPPSPVGTLIKSIFFFFCQEKARLGGVK